VEVVSRDPAQWRQWRALVPVPRSVAARNANEPLFDANRFLVLDTGARVWIMCRQSQRTFAMPRDAYAALVRCPDEPAFRASVSDTALAPDAVASLLLLLRGADPHSLIA
jgi:hypothetical protein